jgi:hypothetical protein
MEDAELEQPDGSLDSLHCPFFCSLIRRIARQCLVSYRANKAPQTRGISGKATVLISHACGLFLKTLTPLVMARAKGGPVKRRMVLEALLSDRKYFFAVTRMRPGEIFGCFADANELSKRIAMSVIERPLRFPIEFVSPNSSGQAHTLNEHEALARETENVDAALRAIVLSHHAYKQTVPECFKLPVRKE